MEWISVKERLPEGMERVICFNLDVALLCCGVAFWNGSKFLFDATLLSNHSVFEKAADKPVKVTHWMILPEPPKNS